MCLFVLLDAIESDLAAIQQGLLKLYSMLLAV